MAAALVRRRADSEEGAIFRTSLARDLYQIGGLIEVCFGPYLDSTGQASIREMRSVGQLGPVLWLIDMLGLRNVLLGLGPGFVNRVGSRVVGNISLYPGGRHPFWGRGWLIANVAVHPDYQRRGIARGLMDAALNQARETHAQWVSLQVEEGNIPAVSLYRSLGFEDFETLSQWELNRDMQPLPSSNAAPIWVPRRRSRSDVGAEFDLVFQRARRGAMAWTQPLRERDVRDTSFVNMIDMSSGERWVLPDPARPDRLVSSLWVETYGWRRARLTYFLDPSLDDLAARQKLLLHVLSLAAVKDRSLQLETVAHDDAIESLLQMAGFRRVRTLIQMRYWLQAS